MYMQRELVALTMQEPKGLARVIAELTQCEVKVQTSPDPAHYVVKSYEAFKGMQEPIGLVADTAAFGIKRTEASLTHFNSVAGYGKVFSSLYNYSFWVGGGS